jgi:mRNA interferase RelE/StbE
MYELLFSDTAKKQFEKLDSQIRSRIGASLERMRIRPEHFVKRLVGNPYYSLRVGDYRVIMDIQQNKLIIFVIEFGHRKNIYSRL